MPCQAPPRGKTDQIRPWDPRVQNDPCGMPALVSVGGVNVANDNLCEQHWLQRYGQTPAYVAAKGGAGGGITSDGVYAQGSGLGFDHAQPGLYFPPSGAFVQQASAAFGNSTRFGRLPCPVSMTITKIRFQVTVAATADDQVDVAIYDANLATMFSSSGALSGLLNVLGVRTANLLKPVPVVAGQVYYVGISTGPVGGTQVSLLMATTVNLYTEALFGANPPQAEGKNNATPIFPLTPSPAVPAIPQSVPIMALLQ